MPKTKATIGQITSGQASRLPYAVTAARATPNGPAVVTAPGSINRLIEAELFTSDAEAPRPVLAVFTGETGNSVELDAAQADRLIADFEAFMPRLRALRDQLATAEAAA